MSWRNVTPHPTEVIQLNSCEKNINVGLIGHIDFMQYHYFPRRILNGDFDEPIDDCKQVYRQTFDLVFLKVFIDRWQISHSALSLLEGEAVNNKDNNGGWPPDLSIKSFVYWKLHDISETQYNHNQISIIDADMAWRIFDASSSANIAMAYHGQCISGVSNIMAHHSVQSLLYSV